MQVFQSNKMKMASLNQLLNRSLFNRLKGKLGQSGKQVNAQMAKIIHDISSHAFLIISREEFNQRETEIGLLQRVRSYISTADGGKSEVIPIKAIQPESKRLEA